MAETVGAAVPPEPPQLSVVIDRHRVAWQRKKAGGASFWVRCGTAFTPFLGGGGVLSWSRLLVDYGPVTIVHVEEA